MTKEKMPSSKRISDGWKSLRVEHGLCISDEADGLAKSEMEGSKR